MVRRWLVHPGLPRHLVVVTLLLTSPALITGWQFDDHFHRAIMLGRGDLGVSPLAVFATARDPDGLRALVDAGLFPWWTPPDFRLAFFRPLSAASMWVDYELWPDAPVLMHLHSLAWCAALVVVATFFYRRMLGAGWWAGLAALLLAIDDASVSPAAWLANRNALLAATFGILALLTYDRWRRRGSTTDAVLSPVSLALALLSGEMAVAAAGYLAAYACFLDPAPWRGRLVALVPHGSVLAAWAVYYRAFGFGAHGSGFYHDPLGRPVEFLEGLASHAPILLLGQWTPVPADYATLLPDEARPAFVLAGVVVSVLGLALVAPLVRASRTARFWALGMTLSLVPISAVSPANRLLLFVSLGAMGLLAQFARGVVEGQGWVPAPALWRVPARVALVLLGITHLVIAPLLRPLQAYSLKSLGEPLVAAVASVPDDPGLALQDLILVNPPDYLFLVSPIAVLKVLEGKPYPRQLRGLVSGTSPVEVTRLGESSLRLRAAEGIYGGVLGRLFRSTHDPIRVGQQFEVPGMTVHVVRTDAEGNPLEFVYTFSVPLDDPSLCWLQWDETGYSPFSVPDVGRSVSLPAGYGPVDLLWRQWQERVARRPGSQAAQVP